MDRCVYSVAELKALSKSPLCAPPDSLLPQTEWIKPIVLPGLPGARSGLTGRRESRSETDMVHASFETEMKLRDSDGKIFVKRQADIVLGPPKISFAASAHKKEDDERDFTEVRSGHRSDRLTRDRETGVGRFSGGRSLTTQRRSDELDGEGKESGSRYSRSGDIMDRSRKFKADDWNTRSERRARDLPTGTKRDEGSWRDRDTDKERNKLDFSRDYRADKYSSRQGEKVPEWLDAPLEHSDSLSFSNSEFANAVASSNLASLAVPQPSGMKSSSLTSASNSGAGNEHSIEEFQAWKARMKAADMERKSKESGAVFTEIDSFVSIKLANSSGDSADRFFSSFGPSVSLDEVKELSSSIDVLGLKSPGEGARASRFSSFFHTEPTKDKQSPPVKPKSSEESASEPTAQTSTSSSQNATPTSPLLTDSSQDKEGFKRIMAILGTKTSRPPQSPLAATSAAEIEGRYSVSPMIPQGQPSGNAPVYANENPDSKGLSGGGVKDKSRGNEQFLMGLMSGTGKSRPQMKAQAPAGSPDILPGNVPQPVPMVQGNPMGPPNRLPSGSMPLPPGLNMPFPGFGPEQADPMMLQQMYQGRPPNVPVGQGAWPSPNGQPDLRAGSFPPPQMPPLQQRNGRPAQEGMPPMSGDRFFSELAKDMDVNGPMPGLRGNMLPQGGYPPFMGGLPPLPNGALPPFPPGVVPPPNFPFFGGPPPPIPPGVNSRIPMPPVNGPVPDLHSFGQPPGLGGNDSHITAAEIDRKESAPIIKQ